MSQPKKHRCIEGAKKSGAKNPYAVCATVEQKKKSGSGGKKKKK